MGLEFWKFLFFFSLELQYKTFRSDIFGGRQEIEKKLYGCFQIWSLSHQWLFDQSKRCLSTFENFLGLLLSRIRINLIYGSSNVFFHTRMWRFEEGGSTTITTMFIKVAQGQTLNKVMLYLPNLFLVVINYMLLCPELNLLKSCKCK